MAIIDDTLYIAGMWMAPHSDRVKGTETMRKVIERIDDLYYEHESCKQDVVKWANRADVLQARVEQLELLLGLFGKELADTIGIAVAHGFEGWPEHKQLGDIIHEKLGIVDVRNWHDMLEHKAQEALQELPALETIEKDIPEDNSYITYSTDQEGEYWYSEDKDE